MVPLNLGYSTSYHWSQTVKQTQLALPFKLRENPQNTILSVHSDIFLSGNGREAKMAPPKSSPDVLEALTPALLSMEAPREQASKSSR